MNLSVRGLMDELHRIDRLNEPERTDQASLFVETYRRFNPRHADHNIRFLVGYCDPWDRQRLEALFS